MDSISSLLYIVSNFEKYVMIKHFLYIFKPNQWNNLYMHLTGYVVATTNKGDNQSQNCCFTLLDVTYAISS